LKSFENEIGTNFAKKTTFLATQKKLSTEILSFDESASVFAYSMESPLYAIINEALRKEDRNVLQPHFPYLRLLLDALNKLPNISALVYRGIKIAEISKYEETVSFYTKKSKDGENTIWWGFSSTTENLEILNSNQFLGNSGNRIIFSFTCKKGKNIKSFSAISTEEEILILPGTIFKVIGILHAGNGFTMIQLEEQEIGFELIE